MLKLVIAYGATAVVFLTMDACWLTLMNARLYRPVLGPLLSDKIDIGAALAFYAIYIAGLVGFAVRPALARGEWQTAALSGALLGLFAYATYDLTNQATLRLWSLKITLADLAWGVTVSAVASAGGFFAAQALGRGGR
ncbi:MAG TPA: DUF2177 family protein [Caulobacteraceae bacterium]|nr:DUF2177 family protein [Caulobacteraceae bacterium]